MLTANSLQRFSSFPCRKGWSLCACYRFWFVQSSSIFIIVYWNWRHFCSEKLSAVEWESLFFSMLVFNSEQLRMCIEEVEIVISVNARAFIPFFCQVGICYWNVSIIFYSHVVVVRVQYTEIRTTHTHNHFFFSIKYFKSSRCWSLLLSSGGGGWLLFETSQNKMEKAFFLYLKAE